MTTVSALGALVALIVSIVLILRKVPPAYGMIAGALAGGLVGGADLIQTINLMITGAQGITNAVLRILAAGILAGVLIESGAANTIAETIVRKVGEKRALLALAVATMLLTAVGVFIDVAVITVSPIALAIAHRADISKMAILLAMVGGGKAGNVMSPNPNTIAAADSFHVPLTSLMIAGIVPGLFGLALAYFMAKRLKHRGSKVEAHELVVSKNDTALPAFGAAMAAPLVAIFLLALRPMAGIAIDPLVALPVGGLIGVVVMGQWRHTNQYMVSGLSRMAPVAIMLLGTGTLAGIIANSGLKDVLISGLSASGMPSYLLAPISGALMSMATASTTAGTAVASAVFSSTLIGMGISALAGAAMVHAGATVLDHMPHGSFFHATGGSVNMQVHERLKLLPYETAVGLMIAFVSTLMFGVFNLAG
ncbi:gluconate:proton symporter [Yersinia pseudotuberculosis]|uniref:Gluconate:proton symporter n=3 Tax=Yersinia pseudotuberculosis complex TaxID=1649845 RepID=A0ABM5PWU6_9GAMM|nr:MULTISPECIES: GntP family permease [Yersinia pseudotuberculosis complex]AHK19079.1 gluconate:proton symporter [Yersinia similis]PSH11455.1 gluconate:proton symporter [Yersinia pseudotuberculosis]CFQ70991.1 GntP family permease [Yersinia similis]CNB64462.1 GntP family permease [Yersinia similis]CNC82211.1 GntP family permease [Yersinia pseudotuberculosis]